MRPQTIIVLLAGLVMLTNTVSARDTRGKRANGCGPRGIGWAVPELGFHDCCIQHDICYSDCHQTAEACNDDFLGCMTSTCKTAPSESQDKCVREAKFYYRNVDSKLGNMWNKLKHKFNNC